MALDEGNMLLQIVSTAMEPCELDDFLPALSISFDNTKGWSSGVAIDHLKISRIAFAAINRISV